MLFSPTAAGSSWLEAMNLFIACTVVSPSTIAVRYIRVGYGLRITLRKCFTCVSGLYNFIVPCAYFVSFGNLFLSPALCENNLLLSASRCQNNRCKSRLWKSRHLCLEKCWTCQWTIFKLLEKKYLHASQLFDAQHILNEVTDHVKFVRCFRG